MRVARIAAALGVLIFTAGTAQAACRVVPFKFCNGCATEIYITLASGAACAIKMYSSGGIAGMETIQAPHHGRFGKENETSVAYLSQPGYVGEDHFESRLYYEIANGKKTFTILRVHATVQAK